MGSPLSPIFVELVMRDLENQCFQQLDYGVYECYRYVDDIFCIISEKISKYFQKTFKDFKSLNWDRIRKRNSFSGYIKY